MDGPQHARSVCECGYAFDCSTSITDGDDKPDEGSVSLCMNCGRLGMYQADLTVRTAQRMKCVTFSPAAWDRWYCVLRS